MPKCHGDVNGKNRVERQDCMQSRQDYIIAVKKKKKKKKRQVLRKIAQDVRQGEQSFAELHGEAILSRQNIGDMCGALNSGEE